MVPGSVNRLIPVFSLGTSLSRLTINPSLIRVITSYVRLGASKIRP